MKKIYILLNMFSTSANCAIKLAVLAAVLFSTVSYGSDPAYCHYNANEQVKKKARHNGIWNTKAASGVTSALAGERVPLRKFNPVNLQKENSTAPVITYSDMNMVFDPVNPYQYFGFNGPDTLTMDLGTDDLVNPQRWTLPACTYTESDNGINIGISSAPFKEYFATATHCQKFIYPGTKYYEFYQFTPEGITLIGSVDDDSISGIAEIDTTDLLMTPLDLTINSSFSIADSEIVEGMKIVYRHSVAVTGFGTLTTPEGDIEVLKLTTNYFEGRYNASTGAVIKIVTNPLITFVSKTGNLVFLELVNSSPTTGSGGKIISVDYGRSGTGPLPVELTTFTSSTRGGDIILNWETATELNSMAFVVERRLESEIDWQKITCMQAAGNSNVLLNYSYTDQHLKTGKYFYRLKMVDNDGTFKYSSVIEAVISAPEDFVLAQNYPNPFNPSTVISFQIPSSCHVTLKVFDAAGNEVTTIVNEVKQTGSYEVSFNGSRLSSGIYYYQLKAGNFTSTKKFTLIK